MLRAQAFLIVTFAALAVADGFSGTAAMDFTRRAVAFGPRPSGSEANRKLQAYILEQVRVRGTQVIEDNFTAKTPRGDVAMKNILVKFPGTSGRAIAITGHFDTKLYPGRHFVGANDGGSSTGVLLELVHALAGQPRTDDLYVVFFDGEEAVGEWTETDSVYGSRHLAERWRADGTLRRLKALINVDMIGDKNLNIKQDGNSSPALRRLVWKTAADLGYQAYFINEGLTIDDDHMPFIKAGVPALDVIDFDYAPWHTDDDTLDKLSGQSMDVVGTVMLEAIRRIERRMKPTLRFAAILFALARTAVCGYRAAEQSLSIDEAFSYNQFITGPWSHIWKLYDANNHILYSILAKLSVRAFRLSEFSLRLPSVLAGFFLVVGIYWVLEEVTSSRTVRCVALIALSLHPLMLDLSIAARGYSLGLAFLVWAIYWFIKGQDLLPGVLLGLGIAANLTILYPAAGLFLCPLVLRPDAIGKRLRSGVVLATSAAAVSGAICYASLSTAKAFNFYAGDPDIRIALLTLIDASIRGFRAQTGLFGNWQASHAILVLYLPLVTIFVLAVSAVAFFRHPSRRLPLVPSVMLLASILELIAAHYTARLNYPIDRLGLYLVLLFGLAWAFAASEVKVLPVRAINGILAGLLTIQFATQFEPHYFQLWASDLPEKQVASRIREETRGMPPGSVKVSASWIQQPALEFYRGYYGISALEPIERQAATPLVGFDYYVLNLKDDDSIRGGNVSRLQALFDEPISGVLLAKEPIAKAGLR